MCSEACDWFNEASVIEVALVIVFPDEVVVLVGGGAEVVLVAGEVVPVLV